MQPEQDSDEGHDTITVDLELDTEDVEAEDEVSQAPTEPPDLKEGLKKIKMPSKKEIIEAVEQVNTISLEVDDATETAARGKKKSE